MLAGKTAEVEDGVLVGRKQNAGVRRATSGEHQTVVRGSGYETHRLSYGVGVFTISSIIFIIFRSSSDVLRRFIRGRGSVGERYALS